MAEFVSHDLFCKKVASYWWTYQFSFGKHDHITSPNELGLETPKNLTSNKINKIIHRFQLGKVFLDLFRGADREPRARNAGPEASVN